MAQKQLMVVSLPAYFCPVLAIWSLGFPRFYLLSIWAERRAFELRNVACRMFVGLGSTFESPLSCARPLLLPCQLFPFEFSARNNAVGLSTNTHEQTSYEKYLSPQATVQNPQRIIWWRENMKHYSRDLRRFHRFAIGFHSTKYYDYPGDIRGESSLGRGIWGSCWAKGRRN